MQATLATTLTYYNTPVHIQKNVWKLGVCCQMIISRCISYITYHNRSIGYVILFNIQGQKKDRKQS